MILPQCPTSWAKGIKSKNVIGMLVPGLRSGYRLGGIAETFDPSSYSEHSSASKMAVSIGGCHLQLEEQFSLVEPLAILEELFEVGASLKLETRGEADPECKLG